VGVTDEDIMHLLLMYESCNCYQEHFIMNNNRTYGYLPKLDTD